MKLSGCVSLLFCVFSSTLVQAAPFNPSDYVNKQLAPYKGRLENMISNRPCESKLSFKSIMIDTLIGDLRDSFDDPRDREVAERAARLAKEKQLKEPKAEVAAEQAQIADKLRDQRPQAEAEYVRGNYSAFDSLQRDYLMYLLDEYIKVEKEAAVDASLARLHKTNEFLRNSDSPQGRAYRLMRFIETKVWKVSDRPAQEAIKQFTAAFVIDEVYRWVINDKETYRLDRFLESLYRENNSLAPFFHTFFEAK